MSNNGSPRFTDFLSLCACSESSPTNLIGSGLNLLCLQIHSKPECRWTWSAFHLSGKIGFPGRKSNGTGLSTENFSKKREYLQRYSSFLVFTGITGKSLYHLLYNTSAVLLGKIHDFARENGVLLHVSVSNMRLSF